MKNRILLLTFVTILTAMTSNSMSGQQGLSHDTISTTKGVAELWFIGHGTLMIKFNDMVIHIDPYSSVGEYQNLPEADLVLVTHQHGDHLDLKAIEKIKTERTRIFCNKLSSDKLPGAEVMHNGEAKQFKDITVEAVPAYNIKHERSPGNPFHPKGDGNGYIITLGDKRVYIAGDTENIPEMVGLKDIYVAFLPMNLPYTMTPEMVAEAAKMFNPRILYPYHYGNTDAKLLLPLVDDKKTEVRIRDLK